MYWFMDSRFNVAFDTAKEVVNEMNYKRGAVDINEVIRVVEKFKKVDIKIIKDRFEAIDENFAECGAAMSITRLEQDNCGNEYSAIVLLNSIHPFSKMRFSLAHELGHIMAQIPHEVDTAEGKMVVSMHIDTNITSFKITANSLKYEIDEQIANIFALLVLMPTKVFTAVYDLLQDERLVADYFGVEVSAVKSRMKLER